MIGERTFTWADQRAFAERSGDWNPMHMDPQSARRTLAGACVVHGVQSMLWMLEQAAGELPLTEMNQLDVKFAQFLYLDEPTSVSFTYVAPGSVRLDLYSGNTRITRCNLVFGPRRTDEPLLSFSSEHQTFYPVEQKVPQERCWEEMAGLEGDVAFPTAPEAVEQAYPRLCAAIGPLRVIGILALTRLVGMVSPGLHSIFHGLTIALVQEPLEGTTLRFSTTRAEARFQLATVAVRAAGLAGTITASRRNPPVLQPRCTDLHHLSEPHEFLGHIALVIGGSRGLGELTAKLLALRGVKTLITYASGRADAEGVVTEIREAGGIAWAFQFDVLAPLEGQLSALPGRLTSMYYFATPRIAGRASTGYSPDRLQAFSRVYVDAFHALCTGLAETHGQIDVFYPSSVYVVEPTASMAEYAMAKAAGEVLAANLTRFHPGVSVEVARLPRLPTDQTNGLVGQHMDFAISWMHPLVDKIEKRVAGRPR